MNVLKEPQPGKLATTGQLATLVREFNNLGQVYGPVDKRPRIIGGGTPLRAVIYSTSGDPDLGIGHYDIQLLERNDTPVDRTVPYDIDDYFVASGDILPAVNDAESGSTAKHFEAGEKVWVWPEKDFDGDVVYKFHANSTNCSA